MERIANQAVTDTKSMIAHEAVSQHPAPGKVLIHPHVGPQLLLVVLPERKPPVHHPADTVPVKSPFVEKSTCRGGVTRENARHARETSPAIGFRPARR